MYPLFVSNLARAALRVHSTYVKLMIESRHFCLCLRQGLSVWAYRYQTADRRCTILSQSLHHLERNSEHGTRYVPAPLFIIGAIMSSIT